MRRASATLCLALALALLAGCGSTDEPTPAACLEGAGTYLRALAAAPGEVRLEGGVPISDCLTENQAGGDLATVGGTMLTVATRLDSEARADPGGAATVQLGFLVGAVERGSEGTQGIHSELVRRLAAAARYTPDGRPPPKALLDAYRRGFDAGRTGG
jgi:hypothetical protein